MHWLPRFLRRLVSLALVTFVLWLGALCWFVAASLLLPTQLTVATDAIVVLTGGRQRLDTGLQLMADGKAKKLFISGVNHRIDRDELLRALGPPASREACCIVLGHDADNTLGNARETAIWMRREGY